MMPSQTQLIPLRHDARSNLHIAPMMVEHMRTRTMHDFDFIDQ